MKALKLFVLLFVLETLKANPIVQDITESDESDESAEIDEEDEFTWRLSGKIYPISYEIELETKVHDEGNRNYSGNVIIHLGVREPTKQIILHSKGLEIDEVFLFNGITTVDEIMFFYIESLDLFVIETLNNFLPGNDLMLLLEFKGQLQLEGVGFYRSEYKINGETRFLATTQFEASHARNAFPVFDGEINQSVG